MDFKNKLKNFWRMNAQSAKGFTLVELIVVIAILAILAGVAVPAYSGYVEKANKAADEQLVSNVEQALQLAYYNGTIDENESASIILSSTGVKNINEIQDTDLEKALIDMFGTNYPEVMKLKYDGWKGITSDQVFAEAYLASSYSGNEDALITQIGSVTNTLKDALASAPNLVGTSFNNYLTTNSISTGDNQAISNAAVLYAAETIGNLDATKEAAVNTAFHNFYNPSAEGYGDMTTLTFSLKDELGTYGAVAAIYAHGEAFGQYVASEGHTDLLEDFHDIDIAGITDTEQALDQVAANLSALVYTAQTNDTINPFALKYISDGQYAKDVSAYLEAMKKIDANADVFKDSLDSAECYTDGTAAALLQMAVAVGSAGFTGCDAGEVMVCIQQGEIDNTLRFQN